MVWAERGVGVSFREIIFRENFLMQKKIFRKFFLGHFLFLLFIFNKFVVFDSSFLVLLVF